MQLFKLGSSNTTDGRRNVLAEYQNPFEQLALLSCSIPEILIGISSCLLETSTDFDQQYVRVVSVLGSLGEDFVLIPLVFGTEIGVNRPDRSEQTHDYRQVDADSLTRLCGYITCSSEMKIDVGSAESVMASETEESEANLLLSQRLLPIEDVCQLTDNTIKDNFVRRVCVMHRWQQLVLNEDKSIYALTRFHRNHAHVYQSHHMEKAAEITSILSLKDSMDRHDLYSMYIHKVMDALKCKPTLRSHALVLRQLLAIVQPYLSVETHESIGQSIERYERGVEPIKMPLAQLRYQANQYAIPELTNSVYLFPYHQEGLLSEFSDVAIAI